MALWHLLCTHAGSGPGLLADAPAKAAVVLAAAALITLVGRRTSAALRHLAWTLAICSSLCLPLLCPVLPAWRMRPMSHLLASAPTPLVAPGTSTLADPGVGPGSALPAASARVISAAGPSPARANAAAPLSRRRPDLRHTRLLLVTRTRMAWSRRAKG